MINIQGLGKGENFIGSSKGRHEDTHLGSWKNSKGFGVGYSNKGKSIISRRVSRIFEIFGGGKGTLDHQSIKLYLVDICYTHQSRQICLEEFFPSFYLSGR
jgi:hypothetical protein